jgi:hypothetical protein
MRSRNHKKVEHLRQGFCQPCGPVVWRNSGQRIPPPRLDGECRGLLVLPTGENHEKPVTPACFKQSQQVLSSVDGTSIADVVPPNVRCVVAVQWAHVSSPDPKSRKGIAQIRMVLNPRSRAWRTAASMSAKGSPSAVRVYPEKSHRLTVSLSGAAEGGRPAYTPSPGSLHH